MPRLFFGALLPLTAGGPDPLARVLAFSVGFSLPWKKGLLPFRPRPHPRYAGSFEYEHEDDDEDDQEPDTDKGNFRASGCLLV